MYFMCYPILFRGYLFTAQTTKKHIVAKDVVGFLLGAVVSTKKRHIVAKDVVGLQVGDSKNNREFDLNEDALIINQK
jgi:hypothetical protein